MFTGIVQDIGVIKSITPNSEGVGIVVSSEKLASSLAVGDSVSINGVCQTATEIQGPNFKVQAVKPTLDKTTLKYFQPQQKVNLELALRPMDRLGGHMVTGHVNGMGRIVRVIPKGKAKLFWISYPWEIGKYLVLEGSVAIDGISLTISELNKSRNQLCLSLVPHSIESTHLKWATIGQLINIEVDILAKYVEALHQSRGDSLNQSSKLEALYKEF